MTSSSSAVQEAEVWQRLRPWQHWVTVPVTTSPAALKGRSTTKAIEVLSEVGRRPVFLGCKARRRTSRDFPLKEAEPRSLKLDCS
jgi:hypothetical protein